MRCKMLMFFPTNPLVPESINNVIYIKFSNTYSIHFKTTILSSYSSLDKTKRLPQINAESDATARLHYALCYMVH